MTAARIKPITTPATIPPIAPPEIPDLELPPPSLEVPPFPLPPALALAEVLEAVELLVGEEGVPLVGSSSVEQTFVPMMIPLSWALAKRSHIVLFVLLV